MLGALTVVSALALLSVFLRSVGAVQYALLQKGYRFQTLSLAWQQFLPVLPIAVSFAVVIGGLRLVALAGGRVGVDRDYLLLAIWIAVAALTIPLAFLTTRLANGLPAAPRARMRKPPGEFTIALLTLLTAIAMLGVVVAPVTALLLGKRLDTVLRLISQFCVAGYMLNGVLQRTLAAVKQSEASEEQADVAASVLYVRPFESEDYVFARVRKGIWRYIPVPEPSTATTGAPDGFFQTFETFMASALVRAVGPLVALGSPLDQLPQANGAAREYSADEDWQWRFADLAAHSSCILATSEASRNVQWELQHILSRGLAGKLFLCTSPDNRVRFETFYLRLWGLLAGKLALRYWGLERQPWSDVAAVLRSVGYVVDDVNPGAGSVVTFDLSGHARILRQGASTPDEYVAAIASAVPADRLPALRVLLADAANA